MLVPCCAQEHIYFSRSNHVSLWRWLRTFVWTMVSGTTESLNCAGNGGTCDHSWLTMLLGNASQFENSQSRVGIWVRIQNQFHFTIPFTSYMLHHSFFLFFFISLSHTKTNTVVPTCFLADTALCLFNWFKSLQIPFIQWEGDWIRGERPNMLQRKGRDAETDQILSSNWISASFHLSSVCKPGLS